MKKRLISSFVMLLIVIPLIIMGGNIYHTMVVLLSVFALKELLSVKNKKKEIPFLIKIICFFNLLLLLMASYINNFEISIKIKVLMTLIVTLLLPLIIFRDQKKYNVEDAFILVGIILLIGIVFPLFSLVREKGINMLLYLLMITIMTDTFAYITGMLIGRNKLIEEISPKKTWEGTIGGSIFGVGIASTFYVMLVDPTINIFIIVGITLFLSLLGQLGDLIFSAIKRYYGVKDFSNLIPAHGGILDRLDSIILVLLGYMLFINIL